MSIITAAEAIDNINNNTSGVYRERLFNALVEEELKKIKDNPLHRFEVWLPFTTFGDKEANIQPIIDAGYGHRYEKCLQCWSITLKS